MLATWPTSGCCSDFDSQWVGFQDAGAGQGGGGGQGGIQMQIFDLIAKMQTYNFSISICCLC